MTFRPRATLQFLHHLRALRRRFAGHPRQPASPDPQADSYVGLFQGVIETAAPHHLPDALRPSPRPAAKPGARTSGFVRLEVDAQKKATGCFLFFVDGKVLTGAIEGASEQTGFVEASFRLHPNGPAGARPIAAVGRLTLETRCARRATGRAEHMTIRFV